MATIYAIPSASNYNAFANGLTVRGVPIVQAYPGKVFWVNNSGVLLDRELPGSDGNDGSYYKPLATIKQAISLCVANRGDMIICRPGHAEEISAAAGIALNVAGVALIGLGGARLCPTITLTTANTATFAVSAANCSISNIRFIGNFLSIAKCINVTATDLSIDNCKFEDTSSVLGFLNPINASGAANTADRLSITNCRVKGLSTSATGVLVSAHDIDGLVFSNNFVNMAVNNSNAIIIITAGVVTNVQIEENEIYRLNTASTGGSLINVGGTTSTGIVDWNFVQTAEATTDLLFTTTVGLAASQNYITAVTGASGYLLPAADV